MLTRLRRVLPLVVAALIAAALPTVLPLAPAAADVCPPVQDDEGGIDYSDCGEDSGGVGGDENGGDEGGSGDGGVDEPTCDLSVYADMNAPTWCDGTITCWGNIPSTLDEDTWEEEALEHGAGPRPSPDHQLVFVWCQDGYGWEWVLPEETGPSLWELAWIAYGNLSTPDFQLAFSPPTQSYVNLETWYWADGPADGEIAGTPAGSVVAYAVPNRLEVDPGDGSGVMECPFEVAENAACSHVYGRASVDHPDGYPARMRLVYDVRFEDGGAVLELDGLPTTLESPCVDGPLPVAEVAAIVIE